LVVEPTAIIPAVQVYDKYNTRGYIGVSATLAVLIALIVGFRAPTLAQNPSSTSFAAQIHELSEAGGSFDTDNLISNERSYLHVLPALKQSGIAGGVYVGVGPDQNFSYIAALRPSMAFIIDVRRDNLLLHLLFKALFQSSNTRAEFLSHLFGRSLPSPPDQWRAATLDKIASQLDGASARDADVRVLRKQVDGIIADFGVPLSAQDFATIDRFHRTFIDAGLSLKFQTFGRAPRSYYPTYRDLLFETDREKRRGNYLNAEADYQFVRGLQQRNLIVPVVGDLAGRTALAAIGRAIRQRGEQLSAIYVSNVELYLFQDGVFPRFADNLATIPHSNKSMIIRSVFSGPAVWSMPESLPGYASASLVQRIDDFAAHKYSTYSDLLSPSR
jgi:hypothetical protein